MEQKRVRIAPLSNSFFFTSIVGFYISVIYVAKRWPDFGVAFGIVFAIMFFASVISFTYAPANALVKMDEYEKSHTGAKVFSYKEYRQEEKKKNKEAKQRKKDAKKKIRK